MGALIPQTAWTAMLLVLVLVVAVYAEDCGHVCRELCTSVDGWRLFGRVECMPACLGMCAHADVHVIAVDGVAM